MENNNVKNGCGCINTDDNNTSCCPTGFSCCTPEEPAKQPRRLEIEFLYLDLSLCQRCRETESTLAEAVAEVARVLEAAGIQVTVRNIHVQTEEQARELGLVSSPTIRINGEDIQLDARESLCESCGDLCGTDVDCRVWAYQGQEYTVPPKAMIIEAILKEVYGGGSNDKKPSASRRTQDIPDNLKRFFAAKRNKEKNNEK